ncbi:MULTISPECIES: DUF305 domain-containing protein [Streptomyces]|uniref:DUF305 domain-containing protein n=2 Tax=Streptomyces TaxID=1883 RepID=A0A2U9P1C9_STRAS|nr:DUF305 domain-containing protein [Streptomyces actuosus]AWT43008.1 DUF305 domain-containing protein [Streptomyces actuosus]MBM4824856.1 DUF305 domain-containing protein [Streptomyces actuosus]
MSNTRTRVRRVGLAALAVSAALTLAACGGGSGGHEEHAAPAPTASAATTAGAHNAQDVAFAQGMIPHHRQALDMAALAAGKASSAQVKDLASRIQKAQDPEIRTMSGWLEAWGEDVPQADGSSMPGMDHSAHTGGHSAMPGMMGDEDMEKLEKASGKAFDAMFLTMMIEHHQGAVQMATTEKAKGRYGPAKAMAGDIVTAQNAEIQEMRKLLGQ